MLISWIKIIILCISCYHNLYLGKEQFVINKPFVTVKDSGSNTAISLSAESLLEFTGLKIPLKLESQNVCLQLDLDYFSLPLHLNGGEVVIKRPIVLYDKALIMGPGNLRVLDKNIHCKQVAFSGDLEFFGKTEIKQHSDLTLDSSCLFHLNDYSEITWNGNGKKLTTSSLFQFKLDDNAKLRFENLTLFLDYFVNIDATNYKNVFLINTFFNYYGNTAFIKNDSLDNFIKKSFAQTKFLAQEDSTLEAPLILTKENKLEFTEPKNYVFNGNEHIINFAQKKCPLIVIANGAKVKVENCNFINVDFDQIKIEGHSSLTFGDNNQILCSSEERSFNYPTKTYINGSLRIVGQKKAKLHLNEKKIINLKGKLILENFRLVAMDKNVFSAEPSSSLELVESDLIVAANDGLAWNDGLLIFSKKNKIVPSSKFLESKFEYNSNQPFFIKENSSLKLKYGIVLDFSNNQLNEIYLNLSNSSRLELNFAEISVSQKKLFLENGLLVINNKAKISATPSGILKINKNATIKNKNNSNLILKNVKCEID